MNQRICTRLKLSRMQAVLAHSLPLKQAKAGLRSLKSWGKVTARNGKVLVAFVLLIRF